MKVVAIRFLLIIQLLVFLGFVNFTNSQPNEYSFYFLSGFKGSNGQFASRSVSLNRMNQDESMRVISNIERPNRLPESLVIKNNIVYGITRSGGGSDNDILFKVNTLNNSYEEIYNFGNSVSGVQFYCLFDNGNRLLGTLNKKIVEFDLVNQHFKVIAQLDDNLGESLGNVLIEGNYIYGTTGYRIIPGCQYFYNIASGVLFRYNLEEEEFELLHEFNYCSFGEEHIIRFNNRNIYISSNEWEGQVFNIDKNTIFNLGTSVEDFIPIRNNTWCMGGIDPIRIGKVVETDSSYKVDFIDQSLETLGFTGNYFKRSINALPSGENIVGYGERLEPSDYYSPYYKTFIFNTLTSELNELSDFKSHFGSSFVVNNSNLIHTQTDYVENDDLLKSLNLSNKKEKVLKRFSSWKDFSSNTKLYYKGLNIIGIKALRYPDRILFSINPNSGQIEYLFDFSKFPIYYPINELCFKDDFIYGVCQEGGKDSLGGIFSLNVNSGEFKNIFDFPINVRDSSLVIFGEERILFFQNRNLFQFEIINQTWSKLLTLDTEVDFGSNAKQFLIDKNYLFWGTKKGDVYRLDFNSKEIIKRNNFALMSNHYPYYPKNLVKVGSKIWSSVNHRTNGYSLFSFNTDLTEPNIYHYNGFLYYDFELTNIGNELFTIVSPNHWNSSNAVGIKFNVISKEFKSIGNIDSLLNLESNFYTNFVLIPESHIDLKKQKRYSVFPNPSSGYVNISGLEEVNINRIKIFDSRGSHVESINLENSILGNSIDISHLIRGLYIIHIIDDNESSFLKIIKQ